MWILARYLSNLLANKGTSQEKVLNEEDGKKCTEQYKMIHSNTEEKL